VFELKKLTNELTLVRLQTRLSGVLSYGTFVPLLGDVLIDSGFFGPDDRLPGHFYPSHPSLSCTPTPTRTT